MSITVTEDGIHEGLPFAEYLSVDAVSASTLKAVDAQTPAHARQRLLTPLAPSPAQRLGTLAHMAILEPLRWERDVQVVEKIDRRTRAGKERQAELDAMAGENPSLEFVEPDQMEAAIAMRDAVLANPYAAALLSAGQSELSLIWRDDDLRCKARLDHDNDKHGVIVDLKTAADASYDGFANAAGKYRYAMQAVWYTDAADAIGLGQRRFVFVVVENKAPWAVALYELGDVTIHNARQRVAIAIDKWRESVKTESFPAYPPQIQTLELKPWHL
jgi:hypothetical protein